MAVGISAFVLILGNISPAIGEPVLWLLLVTQLIFRPSVLNHSDRKCFFYCLTLVAFRNRLFLEVFLEGGSELRWNLFYFVLQEVNDDSI